YTTLFRSGRWVLLRGARQRGRLQPLGDSPWQQLLQAIDRMRRDALEDVSQVEVRIYVVEPAGADQTVEPRSGLAAGVGAGEQVVATAEHERADRTFRRIIVDLDGAVLDVSRQRTPSSQRVLDGLRQRRLHRERRVCSAQPRVKL